jgi:hypothetical protein
MLGVFPIIDPDIFCSSHYRDGAGLIHLENCVRESDLKGNFTRRLADEVIGQRQRKAIGCTGGGHAQMPMASEGGSL